MSRAWRLPASPPADPFRDLQIATQQHRARHQCGAYSFEDGPALTQLVRTHQPARILELGTALGYTACCLAAGSAAAQVDTIEGDAEHVRLARGQIARYDLQARISLHHGDFMPVIAGLAGGYDLAFFDGFAPTLRMLQRLHTLLVSGGRLICANLQLGHGEEARLVAAVCANRAFWSPAAAIEQGRTVVLVKAGV